MTTIRFNNLLLIGAFTALNFASKPASASNQQEPILSSSTVISASDLNWGHLNPLRGDKSPAAANLWGDRTKNTATGMLVKFKPGFSSPAHIHNITYRGVVIKGLLHNDDPNAEKLWLPKGSYWTQPAGESHITAANGQQNLIYLEIDHGPYLVKPSSQQYDNGERPVNLHADNLVWLPFNSAPSPFTDVEISHLWGKHQKGQPRASLLKLPKGFKGTISATTGEFKAVVIDGQLSYQSAHRKQPLNLSEGSYFGSDGQFGHNIKIEQAVTLYLRTTDQFELESL